MRAFAARYGFRLFSNFTFFLEDPENGDGIEQTDGRYLGGVYGSYARVAPLLGVAGRWAAGAGTRADFARVGLFEQAERVRLGSRVDARIDQASFFAWAQRDLELSPRLRLRLGARGTSSASVDDVLGAGAAGVPNGSGVRWRGVLSPRANLAFQATPSTTLFANLGTGFHSNDARDVLGSRHTDEVLPRALGGELGARHSWPGGSLAAAVWGLGLESELVYVGDEGVTEPNGRTRRVGVDLEARARLAGWLWADADLNLARGRYRDFPHGANRIPLAPTRTAAGGLTVRELGPVEGGLRFRHVGRRAANEDASVVARGHTLWEVFGGWTAGPVRVFAALDNLLGAEWNEAQFDTTSRLRHEPEPVGELHFTPGAPRSVQVGVEYRF